jgi:hypothetical protein
VIRHAARGVPWLLIVLGVVMVAVLLQIVEQWPYRMWPLQGIGVGLVAATTVWCFDEPAAAVVDTLPRSLAWRTVARALGVLVVTTGWLLSVLWTQTAYFGKADHVAWQGVIAVLAGTTYATWRRSRGDATPARPAATALVCGTAYLALARPMEDLLPVFPYTSAGPWTASAILWAGLAAASATLLLALLAEIRSPHNRRTAMT